MNGRMSARHDVPRYDNDPMLKPAEGRREVRHLKNDKLHWQLEIVIKNIGGGMIL